MKLRNIVGIVGLAVFVASWIAVAVGFAIHVDKRTWVILVVIAAVATEAMIWCSALMLGLGVLEARSRIWRWMRKPFTRISME